jgi:hypothetical protein
MGPKSCGEVFTQGISTSTTRPGTLPAALLVALFPVVLHAEPVTVRYQEGALHGFLTLRTMEGKTIADGDLLQVARGDRLTSRLVFHFKDGSIQDETIVYSDHRTFRLLSDHLVQRGPSFPHPMEVTLDGTSGQVTVRSTDEHGKESSLSERLELPADLTNGMMILTQLKNVRRGAQVNLSMVATTPKPRLVKLAVSSAGEERFSLGSSTRKATHYVVKVELGGVAGLLAPLVGKQPPDSHVWILGGKVPAFVKSESPFFLGGPPWRIELAKPAWPAGSAPATPPSKSARKPSRSR